MSHPIRWRTQLAALLACALLLRLVAAVAVQQWVESTPGRLCLIAGDAEGYWALARTLVHDGKFEIYDPPRQILRMPGFPLWLAAGMTLFGDHVLWHRIGLALAGTAACGLVGLLGRLLAGETAGLVAGWLAALSPPLILVSVLILSETLFAATLTGNLVLLALLWKNLTSTPLPAPTSHLLGLAFTAGLAGAVATLVRPTWLPFVPACGLLLALQGLKGPGRRELLCSLTLCLGLAAGMAPWVLRNARVTGRLVVTTLWAGPSLYDGLNPQATGESDMQFIETDGLYQTLSEYDADRHYKQAAIDFARQHPLRAIELGFIKFARFWNPFPNASQFGSLATRLGLAVWSVPLMLTAALGAWFARRNLPLLVLSLGPVLFLTAVHVVFIGSVRYRLPAEYPLLVCSAIGLQRLAIAARAPSSSPSG